MLILFVNDLPTFFDCSVNLLLFVNNAKLFLDII